ncbi:P-loop containing nucleoside triphosphate hydrolase protein [Phlebopus sp. FC_14]|nr:P-loop containing nucleoside triphosphate hydrolase protein [Phlebopus sp. FC_14]
MPGPSGKQRRAQLQLKRAIKRGDVQRQPPSKPNKKIRRSPKPGHSLDARQVSDIAAQTARKLQSTFVKLDKAFLDETREIAGSFPLERPIGNEVRVLREDLLSLPWVQGSGGGDGTADQPSVPRRPKWKYTMSKAEVDANEQGHFRKWLAQQDMAVAEWQNSLNPRSSSHADHLPSAAGAATYAAHGLEHRAMPHPPTHFERNLEVWRQLWRVTEISDILLLLLDSRCPPLHLPPSLAAYLNIPISSSSSTSPSDDAPTSRTRKSRSSNNTSRAILVLTKVDISGPARTEAWTSYLQASYPGVPVVPVGAYAPKQSIDAQGRTRHEPYLAGTFRERLVRGLSEVHAQMLVPPEWFTHTRDAKSDVEREVRVRSWRPRVRREVDWERLKTAKGTEVGKVVEEAAVSKGEDGRRTGETAVDGRDSGVESSYDDDGDGKEKESEERTWKEPEFLTVGLIGQPNVGKSSLLNALFGTTRVRASRTPGKTKHFQTLFWTSDVRLVDCPGLVIPSFVPMDMQVLSGVLPISRISAIPFCVHQLAQLLPLERILKLTHPSTSASPFSPQIEDKRTWRDGQRPIIPLSAKDKGKAKGLPWTAMDIMTAYANKKGWVTAKAGRPDVHRAGNAILRLVAEGKIPWAFWPPRGIPVTISTENDGDGIWLRDGTSQHEADEVELDDEESAEEEEESGEEDSDVDSDTLVDDEDEEEKPVISRVGRFGALSIDGD